MIADLNLRFHIAMKMLNRLRKNYCKKERIFSKIKDVVNQNVADVDVAQKMEKCKNLSNAF